MNVSIHMLYYYIYRERGMSLIIVVVVVVTLIGIIVVIVVLVIIIIIFRGHVASNHWLDRAMLRRACFVAVVRLHDDEGRGLSVGLQPGLGWIVGLSARDFVRVLIIWMP